MRRLSIVLVASALALNSCTPSNQRTLADLKNKEVPVKDASVEGGLDKAMEGYQKFLDESPASALTPEAIRRLADLNIQKEYGVISNASAERKPADLAVPEKNTVNSVPAVQHDSQRKSDVIANVKAENSSQLESRATQQNIKTATAEPLVLADGSNAEDLQTAGAKKAIALYLKLLKEFPAYERNDQVLYQLSRAYEEIGKIETAMTVMNQLVTEYPQSRHIPEVQFRRAEYYFTRKKYLDAEDAYKRIIDIGKGTEFYELALYKRGWAFYKQDMYEEALQHFTGLLDHKVSLAYDFQQTENVAEKKRIDDTFYVISLGFSNLGGASAISDYFKKFGSKSYESDIYSHLGEFFLSKRRYADAAMTYKDFVQQNPYHKVSPHFNMRVIDIYHQGGFPMLVVEAKKDYASAYGLQADYWKYFDVKLNADIVAYLQKNIIDLANYYHALYQDNRHKDKKETSFFEATHWYRQFLLSFPKDELSSGINYQLADLLLENKDYISAAIEYEKAAYDYPQNEKSSSAGYASVYAYRENLKFIAPHGKNKAQQEVIRASLRFVDVFPRHEKAAIILSATADDLYTIKDYALSIKTAQQYLEKYPEFDKKLTRSAWVVIAYASFDLLQFAEAEHAYIRVLDYTEPNHSQRKELMENLAATIYKQGEQALKISDHQLAADHFLRVGKLAPDSKIRMTAEYDAATALMQLKNWSQAATTLLSFRKNYPQEKLQAEVTTKLAYIYSEDNKHREAAIEFEKIVQESTDPAIRRESLSMAAELYEKIPDMSNALRVHKLYVQYFPGPVEQALEIYSKIAKIYKANKNQPDYLKTLNFIIKSDASAGRERNDRTRYLAGMASLAILEPIYDELLSIKLVQPFKKNLAKKKTKMKENIGHYNRLVDYKVGDVTAAATYYIAETYHHFGVALMESERPANLSELELEQYNLVLEEEAYPFEEKAINIHKSNIELLSVGVYSAWIDKSLMKLAQLVPGRYAKYEESTGVLKSMLRYQYSQGDPALAGNEQTVKSLE